VGPLKKSFAGLRGVRELKATLLKKERMIGGVKT
tara:strand:- start:621 stop:722 length:102 start_codon:yes stop_codon:yes gene_type:complete